MQMKTKVSAMGQEIEAGNDITNISECELKSVTAHGFTISNTLKHMKIKIAMMGEEQMIDSEDPAARNNPQYGDAFNLLNKPYDIEVENKKLTIKGEAGDALSQMGGIPGLNNDQAKLFLTKEELLKLKEGNQWKDSSIAEGSRLIYEYTVVKTGDITTELLVKANMQIDMTVKQMGMDVKQSLKGTVNGRRQYSTTTGLLVREDADIAISGNMEMLGQASPMNMTGKMTTTIN
jgi:hypothetical protein